MTRKFDITSLLRTGLVILALICIGVSSADAADEYSGGNSLIDTAIKEKWNEKPVDIEMPLIKNNNYGKVQVPERTFELNDREIEAINNPDQYIADNCSGKQGKELADCKTKLMLHINNLSKLSGYSGDGLCASGCAPRCYYKALTDCTFCGLFRVVFNTASVIGKFSIDTFSGSVIKVVILGFALWIAVQILGFVSSIETRDFKDLASSLLQQGFIVAVVIILLQTGASSFFNLALKPIFMTGMNIAEATISPPSSAESAKQATEKAKAYAQAHNLKFDEKIYLNETNASICDKSAAGILSYEKGGSLPPEMGGSIVCTMTLIQNRAAKVKALGSAMLCQSWEQKAFIIPHLGLLLTGIGFWLGGIIIIVAVPFLMIDAVFELAVAVALLPAAIGAYAFKLTRRYVKTVWDTFINSMFTFVFVCLIALMLTTAFGLVISETASNLDLTFDDIVNSSSAEFTKILENFGWFTVAFLKICFVLILTWTVLGEAKDFAGQFSGSLSSTAIGSSVGTMGASFAKSAATKVGKPLAEATTDHLWKGAKRTMALPVHGISRVSMKIQSGIVNRKGAEIKDDKGNIIGKEYKNKKILYNADGTEMFSVTKNRKTRGFLGIGATGQKTSTTFYGANFTIKSAQFTRKNGAKYSKDEVSFNSNLRRDLYNKKGEFDAKKFNEMLEATSPDKASRDKFRIIAAKIAVQQAMPNMKQNILEGEYLRQEAIYDNEGNFVGYMEYHPDGSKTEVRMSQIGTNGRVMADFTHTGADGKGVRLTTDGVINRKQKFKTLGGVDDEIDEQSVQSIYAMSAYYHNYQTKGLNGNVQKGLEKSLFDEEERKKAHQYTTQKDEYKGSNMYEFKAYT